MITEIGELTQEHDGKFLKMWKTSVGPAKRTPQDHRHPNYEIALVLSGSGNYQTVNGLLPILPGDIFVFPSNEPHKILEINEIGLELINLHFDFHFFYNSCPIGTQYPNLFFAHSNSFLTRIPAAEADHLSFLFKGIYTELSEKQLGYESNISAYLNFIFVALMRSKNYYSEETSLFSSHKILKSLAFINDHYCEQITLAEIAEKSNLSPNYFTTYFRKCFNVKLWDYIISKRIDKAKMLLLQNSDLTIMDIAASCGFNNTSNFNKAFLAFTNTTPSDYKLYHDLL